MASVPDWCNVFSDGRMLIRIRSSCPEHARVLRVRVTLYVNVYLHLGKLNALKIDVDGLLKRQHNTTRRDDAL